MSRPFVNSWIEQTDDIVVIINKSRQIRPLVAIAVWAGICQILRFIPTSVLKAGDVIDLK